MFLPFGDDHPPERRPYVNYALLAANCLVYVLTLGLDEGELKRWMLVPADFQWSSVFTSMFMHENLVHLGGNMLFLWIFGANVEHRLTHLGYLAFYLATGVTADLAHVLGSPDSPVPTLGASGAISGVMGAYIVFFPSFRVKTFVWLWWFVRVFWIPALWWIGLWFLEQVLLETRMHTGGGVAYLAHIGGFVSGAALAGLLRGLEALGLGRRRPREAVDEKPPERRFFAPVPEEPGIDWMDESGDGYSVLRLSSDPADPSSIAQVVSRATGETITDVAGRLDATQGMIVRSVPRATAARIQRELHMHGIPSAIILHNRSNVPPAPVPVEGVSWDDWAIRLRIGEESVRIPWSSPFLFVGAKTDGRPFIDLFLSRGSAYRIPERPPIGFVDVDPSSRTETRADLGGFARAALGRAAGAAIDSGVRAAAGQGDWGRLAFRSPNDYDDYVFWLYNLILARTPQA